jgi:hypothetical protein
MVTDPQADLRNRRLRALNNQASRINRRLEDLYRLSDRYARLRLAIFIGGVLLSGGGFALGRIWLGGVGGLISAAFFITAIVYHQRIDQSLIKHQIWLQLKLSQIARMERDWAQVPPTTFSRASGKHPFARDLDLTGDRSLHRLLDTAVSREGSQRLKDWLLDTHPDLGDIQRRQKRVQTLVPLALFRNKLSLNGSLAATGSGGWWQGERLLQWLDERAEPQSLRLILIISSFLVPLNIILFLLNALGQIPAYWIPGFIIYAGLLFLKWRETTAFFDNALTLQIGLKKLEAVFQHLETFPLERYPALKVLGQPFLDPNHRPSDKLKRISHLVAAAGLVQNPVIGLALNIVLPWNIYFAHRLNQYKDDIAHHLPNWLEVWFELEALSSLAEFAYLNPGYTFPEIMLPTSVVMEAPLFQAQNMGHPLIPVEQKVCNDFTVMGLGEIDIITGSNMSGKSTFLRTVGINLCLAYAGGPVDATVFRTSLFRLFSSLNVSDSVTDGISYFYAEVKRLKALLSELEREGSVPLCYLIDEIFRGTNNRERYIGSRAYIRALVGQSGLGLIATHDLELVKLADEFPEIKNYHFREEVVNGQMTFDYRLRPGPCPTTNALKIMQLAGLPVELVDETPIEEA